ncbi:putative nuclease HARBI1 [Lucilia cuprina]|uniref:putative nuclease HARBI1 n=1 Tax=Lucilia cuprina TaxID=7375 RepID=UPI001F064639|nr:putative nuclease HARBI1 [Lucilia cuprina]
MPAAFMLSIIALKKLQAKKERIKKRVLRDSSNPMDIPEKAFIAHYRLNKAAFTMILDEIGGYMNQSSIPKIVRLAGALRFLAVGSFQGVIANDINISMDRTTFCKVMWDVLNIIEDRLCPLWIQLDMNESESNASKLHFYEKYKIPGVIGSVDGTHVRLVKPPTDPEVYYCRKGYYSLNVMVICDNQMKVRAVDASRPGSCHDAFVWNLSDANKYFAEMYLNGIRNSWLLADSAYALEPYVLVPYKAPSCGSMQHKFNLLHSSARNIVERTIGNLKSRFRCLQMCLPYTPLKVVKLQIFVVHSTIFVNTSTYL